MSYVKTYTIYTVVTNKHKHLYYDFMLNVSVNSKKQT